MEVKASYTAPGTKQFTVISESGSTLLRKHVLHKLLESEQEAASDAANRDAVALTTANYRFSLLGCASGEGRPRYVMRVEPLREDQIPLPGNHLDRFAGFRGYTHRGRAGQEPVILDATLANPSSVPENRRVLSARVQPDGHRCAARR